MGKNFYTTAHSNTITCPNCNRQFSSKERGRCLKLMKLHIKKCCPEKTHVKISHYQREQAHRNDLKVSKDGFKIYEKRDSKKHYGADGQKRTMKFKRSNFKYPRANNRYSIWNSRKRSSEGQVGFKILRKNK